MKITIEGCEPLHLTEELIAPESGKFNAETSYASKLVTRLGQKVYREKKLPAKLECLRILRTRARELGGYKSYYEPLAGVGLAAKLFAPTGKVWLNDMDPSCQQVLKANFPKATVWGGDMNGQGFPDADMIFLDFNDYTFKRYLTTSYAGILERAFDHAKKFVVLNDCSIFYFRYGESSFKLYSKFLGKKISSREEYFKALRDRYPYDEWKLAHVAYFSESSFQLFYRGETSLKITQIRQGLPVKISEGLLS